MSNVYVGIYVTNEKIEIYVLPSEECWDVGNDHAGMEEMVERLRGLHPRLIVLKVAGGMETLVAATLYAAGLPVAVVNNQQVRDFANTLNISDRSDVVDAHTIARFAKETSPQSISLTQEQELMFRELVRRRHQLVEIQTAEAKRLQRNNSRQVSQSIHNLIKAIEAEIDQIDRKVDKHIKLTHMHSIR